MTSAVCARRLVAHHDQARIVVRALRDAGEGAPSRARRSARGQSASTCDALRRELRRAFGEPLRRQPRSAARSRDRGRGSPTRRRCAARGRLRRGVVRADDHEALEVPSVALRRASATCAWVIGCRERARPPRRAPARCASSGERRIDEVRERPADPPRLADCAGHRGAHCVGVRRACRARRSRAACRPCGRSSCARTPCSPRRSRSARRRVVQAPGGRVASLRARGRRGRRRRRFRALSLDLHRGAMLAGSVWNHACGDPQARDVGARRRASRHGLLRTVRCPRCCRSSTDRFSTRRTRSPRG